MTLGLVYVIAGAAIAVIASGIGSMIGVGKAGQVGAGIMTQEPEKFGKILVLEALPGTQGIYGFLAAVMVVQKVGLLGGQIAQISSTVGLQLFFACLPIAIAGLVSAIYQGKVCVSGMNIVVKQPSESGKAIILAAMVETYAVLGLLTSILLINGISIG
ncbi:MAG: permease [Parcubacteria group bacterium GW2011_GWA2_38_13b]|nr:MAG: permease [Parcubacteria group bacterium GW2011_GWA2_38_13b]